MFEPRKEMGVVVRGSLSRGLEMRLDPFGRKSPRAAPQPKLRCVAAFNEQNGKVTFRKTLTQRNYPTM